MCENISDRELIARADELRREATGLLEHDGLLDCFAQADAVEVVGSVITNLMTRRDIDITCCLDPLEPDRLLALGRGVLQTLPVARLTYIDPGVAPWHDYTRGLYCNLKIQATPHSTWNVDVWAYTRNDFNLALANHRDLASRLAKIDRFLLLKLKSSSPGGSFAVYTAVLDHGVRSTEGFDRYLQARDGQEASPPGA